MIFNQRNRWSSMITKTKKGRIAKMVKDLVCGMQVDENNPETQHLKYEGETYYFCTPLCWVQFEAEPERFIKDSEKRESKRKHRGEGNPRAG